MKKQNLILLALTAIFFTMSWGCKQGGSESYTETEDGLLYKFIVESDNEAMPEISDIITVTMDYGIEDSTMFTSVDVPQPIQMQVNEPLFKGGFMEGFTLMHLGDSAEFLMKTDSVFKHFFRSKTPPGIDTIEYMWFRIGLEDIKTQEEAAKERQMAMEKNRNEEKVNRDAYLKEHSITVEPTESGLYYIETKKGSGKTPEPADTVQVHYTGYLLDGTKFDSSLDRDKVFEFPLGQGRVIPGWDEGIGMMRVGGKARLIIPSSLGYGERGAGQAIPPFSTLIFDVELVGIK